MALKLVCERAEEYACSPSVVKFWLRILTLFFALLSKRKQFQEHVYRRIKIQTELLPEDILVLRRAAEADE